MGISSDGLFAEFLSVAAALNRELSIAPVLYGSLGLELITGHAFSPQDIDMLIPLEFLHSKWGRLQSTTTAMGYELVDLHEHEFMRNGLRIAFAFEEDLAQFAGVDYTSLQLVKNSGVMYRQLTLNDFLRVYSQSVNDGYRRTKNNNKDRTKIQVIQKLMEE